MDIENIPQIGHKKPKNLTVSISEEDYEKLKFLKDEKQKNISSLIRMLLSEFFDENKAFFSKELPRGK